MRLSFSFALALLTLSACRNPAPPSAIPALARHWAEPVPFTWRAQAGCDVPDGGATLSIFSHADAWMTPAGDCGVSPLACPTASARAQVLRELNAVTLPGGPLSLANFPPGPRKITLEECDYYTAPLELLMPETGTLERKVTLQPWGKLTGVVLERGKPVARLPVWAEGLAELTDANGRFHFDRLPPRPLTLRFGLPGRILKLPVPGEVQVELTTGSVRELPLSGL